MQKIKLKIEGMHCTSCAMSIDMDLEELKGVKCASTNYAKSETEVEMEENEVGKDQIIKVIENLGYKANILNV